MLITRFKLFVKKVNAATWLPSVRVVPSRLMFPLVVSARSNKLFTYAWKEKANVQPKGQVYRRMFYGVSQESSYRVGANDVLAHMRLPKIGTGSSGLA